MADKISVDTSKLLGFDQEGQALFSLGKATDGSMPKMTGIGGKGGPTQPDQK